MNIFKLLFGNQNIELIRVGDNLILPDRSDLNCLADINKLYYYKKHYIEKLFKNNCITTLEFNSKKLKDEMNMNISLVLKFLMNNDYFYEFSSNDLIIETIKLNSYLNRVNELQKEVILRLIALKEIEIDGIVPKYNKNTLLEEINTLSVILHIFYSQIGAIKLEIDNYFDMIKDKDINEDISNLKQRFDILLYLASGIIDKCNINELNDIKYKIAVLEVEFEKYVYLNKDKLEEAKVELSNLENDIKDKEELLSRCINIEKLFIIFKNFSNNLDLEEYIYKLSEIKFKLLTENIQDIFNNSITKNDLLFDYYLNILSVKIENILSGNNTYFNDTFFLNEKDAVYVFRDCLKENGIYNLESILVDKFKLSLVLSFDEENGYERMLKNIIMDCSNIAIGSFPGIVWDSKVSIHAILSMIERKENITDSYYILFLMYYQAYLNIHDEYYLPEGIVEFHSDLLNNDLYKQLEKDMIEKTVYLPSTLKVLSGPIFSNNEIGEVIFNHNIEKINDNTRFNNKTLRLFRIPSNLICGEYFIFLNLLYNMSAIKNLEFQDARNSRILCNEEELGRLLKYLVYSDIDQIYWGKYSLKLCVDSIIIDLDGKKHIIDKDNLVIRYREDYSKNEYVAWDDSIRFYCVSKSKGLIMAKYLQRYLINYYGLQIKDNENLGEKKYCKK